MGRTVIRHLLADRDQRWRVRLFTRNPHSHHAQQLEMEGGERLEVTQGDLNDQKSLASAFAGAYGVFCNTDFFSSANVQTEYEQGLRALETARQAAIQHFIYSSLDAGASISHGRVPVPHYDAKAAVEHWIDMQRSHEFMQQETDGWYSRHVSVLVTGPYYENLQSIFLPQKGKLADGREGYIFKLASGGKPYPMVALEDIAWFVSFLLTHADEWGGRTLPILGESLSIAQVAATFERVTGKAAEWQDVPLEQIRSSGSPIAHDIAHMLQFFQEYGVTRDFELIRRLHPGLLSFEAWLRKTGWNGEAVQGTA